MENNEFGWKNYLISIMVIVTWNFVLIAEFWVKYFYVIIPLYILTVWIACNSNKKLPVIIMPFAIFTAALAMFTILGSFVGYLQHTPFHLPASIPVFIRFIYLLYPPIVASVVTVLLFYYPLNRIFQEKSRFCIWCLTVLTYAVSHPLLDHNNDRFGTVTNLSRAIVVFYPIVIWFFTVQFVKILSRQLNKQSQEVESAV